MIKIITGPIEFLNMDEVLSLVGTRVYLHMLPWEGAFVTLFETRIAEYPFGVTLQVEEVTSLPIQPNDPVIYRLEERSFIRLAIHYVDADSDVVALIGRLAAELDCWKPADA